ncbi:hypothetical protein ACSDR0_40970 [Streptosporangium sp. G11]|uniref:SCO4225 family membrane protein n=1 Tax=Streptosporangium sp. G11 TaxID=3436926 RepID=UPI003EBEF53F
MRIQVEGIIAGVYAILVLAAAAHALPHLGKRGGLEFAIILFVAAPSSFLVSWLFERFRLSLSPGPVLEWVLANGDKVLWLLMTIAGLLQAILLFFAIRWLRGIVAG